MRVNIDLRAEKQLKDDFKEACQYAGSSMTAELNKAMRRYVRGYKELLDKNITKK